MEVKNIGLYGKLKKNRRMNMIEDEKYELNICVKNAPISPRERQEVERILNEQGIGIVFLEYRGIMNSVFDAIPIYLNPEIVNLLVTNMMTSAMYDALKTSLFYMVSKITSRLNRNDKKSSGAAFRMKIGNIEINADIPTFLGNEQFSRYMDMLQETSAHIAEIQKESEDRATTLFMVYDEENECLDTKTIAEYVDIEKNKRDN